MTVLTISREFGCGGEQLAIDVATALDFHLVDKVFISGVLCEYGLTEFDLQYDSKTGFWEDFDADRAERRDIMVSMLNRVVRMVARHGNSVILGRSGYAILSGLNDVLHVRLHAPFNDRVANVARQKNLSEAEAVALVKEKDNIRVAFIESFYRVPWESPLAFDVSINTSVIPVEIATQWVLEAARHLGSRPSKRPTSKQLEIDPVLMQTIVARLGCANEHV